ncbi:MAG: hypothetical protein JJ877_05990 [Thalassococcus sp.]|uniref:hypothetical protein n=1 Tax=Thalassococcus sp. TaxID=1928858 RepID=UPI001B07E9C3|nr:hypothetical protein [Thalassococcus sp.]MBO6866576.1 hypothetical protein [Thalassococcus sp.]
MNKKGQLGSFTDLYQHTVGGNDLLSSFLPGHLAIEFLLRKLLVQYDAKLERLGDQLTHARLVQLCFDLDLIDSPQRDVLLTINAMRNKLAHNITYAPSLDELRALWSSAAKAFSDLTDGISQGIESLAEAETISDLDGWEFAELFVQITYDLHEEYVGRGGDMEEF